MPGVVEIPVRSGDPVLFLQSLIESGSGVGGQDVERGGLDAPRYSPVNRFGKDGFVIVIQAKDEAAIDHYAVSVKRLDHSVIIQVQIVGLVVLLQVSEVECLEPDEKTS